jgi:hypothetical protein
MFETELLEIHSWSICHIAIDFKVFNGGFSGVNFVYRRVRLNGDYEYWVDNLLRGGTKEIWLMVANSLFQIHIRDVVISNLDWHFEGIP